jgi:hypothetical protein
MDTRVWLSVNDLVVFLSRAAAMSACLPMSLRAQHQRRAITRSIQDRLERSIREISRSRAAAGPETMERLETRRARCSSERAGSADVADEPLTSLGSMRWCTTDASRLRIGDHPVRRRRGARLPIAHRDGQPESSPGRAVVDFANAVENVPFAESRSVTTSVDP